MEASKKEESKQEIEREFINCREFVLEVILCILLLFACLLYGRLRLPPTWKVLPPTWLARFSIFMHLLVVLFMFL